MRVVEDSLVRIAERERVGTPRHAPGDADRFAALKRALEQWLWAASLERLLTVEMREGALRRHA